MNNYQLGFEGIKIAISAVACILAYAVVYRQARLDAYRQDLFEIRNGLWMFMAKRNSLDSPAHLRLRSTLNSAIKVAPHTNLFVIVGCMLVYRQTKRISLREMIDQERDVEVKAALATANERLGERILRHIFLGSFPGVLIGYPLLAYAMFRRIFAGIRNNVGSPFESFPSFSVDTPKLASRFTNSTFALGAARLPVPV